MVNGANSPLPGRGVQSRGPLGRHPTNLVPPPHSPKKSMPSGKRPRPKDYYDSDEENEESIWDLPDGSFYQYITINSTQNQDKSLDKQSVFAIGKQLNKIGINPEYVNRSGSHLDIKVNTARESKKLLAIKEFCGIPVKVSPHKTLNYSKGVVKHREFEKCTEEEMETIEHVTDAYRIYRTINGTPTPTGKWILTFDMPICPNTINVWYIKNIPVEKYIPKPMRCYNCQRFGHTKKRCKGRARCKQCGDSPHGDTCDKTPFCPNCNQPDHTALSAECPQYQKIRSILKYQAENGGSYQNARDIIFPKTKTYSNAVKNYPKQVQNKPNQREKQNPQQKPKNKSPQKATTKINKTQHIPIITNNRFDMLNKIDQEELPVHPQLPSLMDASVSPTCDGLPLPLSPTPTNLEKRNIKRPFQHGP